MKSHRNTQPQIYEIQVRGELDRTWEPFLDNFSIRQVHAGKAPTTLLVGSVADQPALRGFLCKLWDMNLTILYLRCIETNVEEKKGVSYVHK